MPPGKAASLHYHAPIFATASHAYHQAACGCDKLRIARHEAVVAAVANRIAAVGPFLAERTHSLGSSIHRAFKIDLVLTAHHLNPAATAFDATVTCSLIPSYVETAASDANRIFDLRHHEKQQKHAPGLTAMGKAYHTLACNTLGGVGPQETCDYFDQAFLRSASIEIVAGLRGRLAAARKQLFYAGIQAAVIKSTADMVNKRVIDTTPPRAKET